MLIQINVYILVVVLDSTRVQNFYYLTVPSKKNLIIFEADVSSSVHINNKGKDILFLGDGPTEGLDDTTLTTKAKCPFNFTETNKNCIKSS